MRPRDDRGLDVVLTVNGEQFQVRRRHGTRPTYDYDWLTAPHLPYGFSSTVSDHDSWPRSTDDHHTVIKDFLAGIDPATGYLGDT